MLKKIKALRAGLVLSEYINRNSVVIMILLLGGIWAIQFNPHELWTIDARFLRFFIISHYFFLLLSALVILKDSQAKARLLR